jgi:hypothetical protein
MREILRGLECVHIRMKRRGCSECAARGKTCRLECPDCGLIWMDEENPENFEDREKIWLRREKIANGRATS